MRKSDLFYHSYDELFENKNYAQEIRAILEFVRKQEGSRHVANVLEIGCGTGNHTLTLAREGLQVTATDIDPIMIQLASNKIASEGFSTSKCILGDLSQIEDNDFDLVVSLFNVVNHVMTFSELRGTFEEVKSRKKSDAFFIFDCWNAIAALIDPPYAKEFQTRSGISGRVDAQTDVMSQHCRMTYYLEADGKSEKYILDHKLWTPVELLYLLESVGLSVETMCPLFEFQKKADAQTRKIMFVCR